MDPGRTRRTLRRALTATATALALPLSMLATGATTARAAGVQCSVDYKTNDWGSGFTTDVTITNRGTDTVDGWTLTYAYSGDQKLMNGWNGSWAQSGRNISVKDAGWNGKIAAGAAVSAGAQFTYSGTNAAPTSFSVNGTACNGAHQPPITVLTSPAAGAVYTQGEAVPLAATAAAADDATISKVEFYDDTKLLGTDTTAPYTLSASSMTVGSHSLLAKAYDSLGASAESTPVGITVASGPSVVATPPQLGVQQGKSGAYEVKLSKQPSANVTVTTTRASGNSGLAVTGGASLTFTPSNWNTAQKVTVTADSSGTGAAVFESTATGHAKASVTVTQLGATKAYDARFLELYGKITNPANGYFSPEGIPYHSVETLIVEAPDHGHETTSEAYGYLLWLQAMYGKVTGDWSKFNGAWEIMEKYMIPTKADQPTNSFYNASKPATYAPELDTPDEYPAKLDSSVASGADPIAGELKSAYGTDDIYGMHWLEDVDNVYGFGNAPGKCEAGPADTGPSYINTFQRGVQESVWETVPQPTCDAFKYGGKNGYLDLFTRDASYAKQWKFTNAPDADARAVQAAYWADVWAKQQGKGGDVSATVGKAAKMGDYLRYAMYDKYFKKIGNCVGPSACPAGTGKDSSMYLLSWYYAWGGATDTNAGWAWRIGSSHTHGGYQNPLAAYALANYAPLKPKSATGQADWAKSLDRQIEFYRWLQSDEGAIAGGATNSWAGRYATPPAGTPTFYGMYYDEKPVYHDPPSNQWFGFQTWSMERVAEYYQQTGNAQAKSVLDKWVKWALSKTTINPDGTYRIPSTLQWSGAPNTWNASSPGSNSGLHVTVADYTNDVGVAAAYAKTLSYYAARSGDSAAKTTAKALLDGMWNNYQDSLGIAVPEDRADYNRFDDPVYIPSGWTGTMPNGDAINSSSTFESMRSFYKSDPAWSKIESYLKGGAVPSFTYHRFWAQADIALAMGSYAELLE
ncbi:glycoside hydrolase family 48 protein [Streptomyces scabiei]|uniref:glycoside hydrolase family 48 protein n=1 Tax=Streptomyces scabiei TaxID=1930 RepID=UPI0003075EE3|nr:MULTISPECIES: glycoside hydrolase family 48 protein [Streptomyces]MBP5934156.1 cellulose 1,4-beta-cellobiosidase [Streptomyces sp. LBUM 1479]MBP5896239.1 cellulose 1,4-beta-cellobiosidase [Streptomyces sp. LBUM 1481]MBP5910964.1 cellulose 1,4-beta-cellobiosidase [Streptomyces sp. LBUM 1486]MBP5926574.1 cellulose 1,4-beta-cellobiosidase [Streptomyces sp. LBUM 1483]MDX2653492.1 glycoside hydrolase family 48 protein [Streptomyces scabiei]